MALALPKIQRRQAGRLSTPDIQAPLREAQTRSAMLSAVGAAVSGVTDATKWYVDKENQRELRDAQLAVHKADLGFVQTHKGVEEFDPSVIEDANFIELTANRDPELPVPGHTVYAEWRQKNYKAAVEEAASTIRSKSARDNFMVAHEGKGASNYANDAVQATKEQIKYVTAQSMKEVESSLLNRDYEGARLVIDSSEMSSVAKKAAMKDIDTREQVDYFNEAIEKREVPVMQRALDQLLENDEKVTSQLDAQTQKVFANQLRTALNTEKTAVKRGVDARAKLQAEDLRTQITDTWEGKPVNGPDMLINAQMLSTRYPKLAREAYRTLEFAPEVNKVILSPPTVQLETLRKVTEEAEGDLDKSFYLGKLSDSIAKGFQQRRTDAIGWAQDVGLIEEVIMDYSTPETMAASLQATIKPTISVQDTYGSFTGFLPAGAVEEFGSRFENAPDKLAFCRSINEAMGDYAEPFYEQLKKYNIGETASLAGQIMTWGPQYQQVADNIIRGAELRKTDNFTQLKMKEVNSELDAFIATEFQGMFTGNLKHRSLMVEALKDVYAVTGDKEAAFEQLTGGTIDFNGYKIQSPSPGMSGREYRYKLTTFAPEYWNSPEMQVYGYTPDQLRAGLIDGSLTQEGIGKGVTQLIARDGSVVKKPDGVTNFQFKFDATVPSRAVTKKEIEAAKAKREQAMAGLPDGDIARIMYEEDLGL